MADANNRLRLQIVTQLDAAGIKATKEQVDQLEVSLRKAGGGGAAAGQQFGQLEKALGNLPGPLGKIGNALGGVAGQAALAIGAFKTGFAIGEQLHDWAVAAYEWASGIKEAKEAAAFAVQQNKELAAAADAAANKQISLSAKRLAAASENVKSIDAETAAYFRQVASLNGLKNAEGDAEKIALQRSKFEDMKSYSDAGYAEAAEQIGKYYDVLEAELDAKRQVEAFDRESMKLTKDRAAAEEKAAKAADATEAAAARLEAEKAKLASIDRHENGARGGMYAKMRAPQLRVVEDAQREYDRAVLVEKRRGEKLHELDALDLQRQLDRANIVASGALGVDRAAQSYDDFVKANGNPLNADVDSEWAHELISRTVEADRTQQEILKEVKNFADMFRELISIK